MNHIPVMFRPITRDDRPYLVDLIALCGPATQRLFNPCGNFYTGGGAGYVLGFEHNIACGHVYVTESDSHLVGLGYLYPSESEHIACFGILVADPYQRQGNGTRLMQFLEDEARDLGYVAFRTSGGTSPTGPLRRILAKRGYVVTGMLNGNIIMEKRLV